MTRIPMSEWGPKCAIEWCPNEEYRINGYCSVEHEDLAYETELAWAAGFFDGEGSSYLDCRGRTPRVGIGHVDPRPLARFLSAVGVGSVTGPYDHNSKNNPRWSEFYSYQAYGKKAHAVIEALRLYLSPPKLEQWERTLNRTCDDGARTGRMSSGSAKE